MQSTTHVDVESMHFLLKMMLRNECRGLENNFKIYSFGQVIVLRHQGIINVQRIDVLASKVKGMKESIELTKDSYLEKNNFGKINNENIINTPESVRAFMGADSFFSK